jgi:DNA polymerase (family 10)
MRTTKPRSSKRERARSPHHRIVAPPPPPPAPPPAPASAVTNADVARIFRETADLLEVANENAFRIRAYRNAARTVEELGRPIAALVREDGKKLAELPGIGEDLAGKIEEIVRRGDLPLRREIAGNVPAGTLELMRLPSIGPHRARLLAERLHVRSLRGLERAARAGKVHELPGFGRRSEQRIVEELERRAPEEARVVRAAAAEYAEALLAELRSVPGVERAEIAGSYRRARETVGDLDFLVASAKSGPVVERFVNAPMVARVVARGHTRAAVRLTSGLNADLRVLLIESYGAALHYFTGSKAHNIAVRRMAQERGLKLSEYGLFKGRRRVGGATEEEVFAAVGLPWIPPELREDRGEIDAAREGRLPELVTLDDIRGDLQSHTTDSDGRASLEEMAEVAEALGYSYLAVTDHTPTVRIVGGLDADGFRRQMRRIDRLNARLSKLTLLRGAEVDVHADGSLDLDDRTLAALDVVLVSLHTKLDLPAEVQTRRLVRALRHPSVDILGHPTGRLIGKRASARFDLAEVVKVAVGEGVMLEINAQPERLDLDDVAARAALEAGATLVISTDAHAPAELGFMHWGVDQARRAWASKHDVANTRTLRSLTSLLHDARRR